MRVWPPCKKSRPIPLIVELHHGYEAKGEHGPGQTHRHLGGRHGHQQWEDLLWSPSLVCPSVLCRQSLAPEHGPQNWPGYQNSTRLNIDNVTQDRRTMALTVLVTILHLRKSVTISTSCSRSCLRPTFSLTFYSSPVLSSRPLPPPPLFPLTPALFPKKKNIKRKRRCKNKRRRRQECRCKIQDGV